VLGSNVNVVVTRLPACAARLGASGPGIPSVSAIDRARVSVAVLLGRSGSTMLPTVANVRDNRLGTALDTTTANFGAGCPSRPTRKLAVNGANESVATCRGLEGTTACTTVTIRGQNRFGVSLAATTASLCACSPGGPATELAVDGARERGAGLGDYSRLGAQDTTVLRSGHNGSRLGLGSSATGLGA
jgi:hypothetical protein